MLITFYRRVWKWISSWKWKSRFEFEFNKIENTQYLIQQKFNHMILYQSNFFLFFFCLIINFNFFLNTFTAEAVVHRYSQEKKFATFSGKKLCWSQKLIYWSKTKSMLQIQDETALENQHDLVYLAKCLEVDCLHCCVDETGRLFQTENMITTDEILSFIFCSTTSNMVI